MRNVADFFSRVLLKPYGVLGTQLTVASGIAQQAPPPTVNEAFVDPAGLRYIQETGPAGAGGAAGAIYAHLGIRDDAAFPQPVMDGVKAPGDAQFHCYADEHSVIHTVGPDLRVGDPSWEDACQVLGRAYHNVLRQFLDENGRRPELCTLRLLPISGGIFAGEYQQHIAPLTMESLSRGYRMLSSSEQQRLREGNLELHLCIFLEKEMAAFEKAHAEGAIAAEAIAAEVIATGLDGAAVPADVGDCMPEGEGHMAEEHLAEGHMAEEGSSAEEGRWATEGPQRTAVGRPSRASSVKLQGLPLASLGAHLSYNDRPYDERGW